MQHKTCGSIVLSVEMVPLRVVIYVLLFVPHICVCIYIGASLRFLFYTQIFVLGKI